MAKDENVPPYAVFSDKTLVDMTYLKPETDGEFLDVSGVGRRKLENYGYEFMQAIRKFLEENPK
ncbi:MAG: HRDC domain-containing protein [Thermoguttaceae bacterium]|nr:HRDC domain-containing protein [Thermoguttaceae bacterium]